MGAAIAAGLKVGVWDSIEEIRSKIALDRVFLPEKSHEWRLKKQARFAQAVERSKGFGYQN